MNWEHHRLVKSVARSLVNRGIPVRVAMVKDRVPSPWWGNGYIFDPSREDCDFDKFVTAFEIANQCGQRGNYAKFFAVN